MRSNIARRNRRELSRKRRLDIAGFAILAACAVGTAGLLYGAAELDAQRGLTVSESMASAGFGSKPDADSAHCKLTGDCRAIARDMAADDGAAELTGRIAAEMDSRGCKMRRDGAAEYTLESCK